ncbi:MAG: hypothetical protein V7K40_17975 [Nostoc sp.]|uniref:hypothetical protein n=1 Tax=Nostoc sp. TaxID=1180 RepID=UPI002FFD2F53
MGNLTVWLDEPDWQEQVKKAFKQGASVSLIAPLDARGDFKSAILSLAVEPGLSGGGGGATLSPWFCSPVASKGSYAVILK